MTAEPAPTVFRRGQPRLWPALSSSTARQLARFAAIGVVSTAAYVGLYAALRNVSSAALANALALGITAVGNTAANRRLTFQVRGRDGLARDHAVGILALVVAFTITSGALGILEMVAPNRGRVAEIAVLVAANAAATLVRFVLLRLAIQCSGGIGVPAAPVLANLSASERTRG